MNHGQPAQNECDEVEVGQNSALSVPTRSAITMLTYEIEPRAVDEILGRGRQNETQIAHRPILPIRYVDRETLERMR